MPVSVEQELEPGPFEFSVNHKISELLSSALLATR